MVDRVDMAAFVTESFVAAGMAPATGLYSNTPVATLHSGSEDRLAVACYCEFGTEAWVVAKQLEEAKIVAQRSSEGLADLVIGGQAFQVRATGYRGKDGGPYFRYVLVLEGCSVLWSGKPEFKGDVCNVQVHLGSLFCMSQGARAAWARILQALAALGAVVVRSAVSRVDVAVDLAGVPVADFMEYYHRRDYVSRGVVRDTFAAKTEEQRRELVKEFEQMLNEGNWDGRAFGRGREETGFMIGKSLQVAVYDKGREVERDEMKMQWLIENRWGGEKPDAATRVEFRLARLPLRNFGVQSVEDWFEKRGNVVAYLVDSWFWLAEDHDRRHTERAEVAPLWQQVQAAFKALFAAAEEVVLKRVKRHTLEYRGLWAQTLGCIGSVIARKYGDLFDDLDELREVVSLEMELLLGAGVQHEFLETVSRKAREFAAAVPLAAVAE